jgi:hypothetical protein
MKAKLSALFRAVMGLIAALLGSYYSAKYALLAKRLGLPHVISDGKRGFIIIQLDGLAYDYLLAAMERGYAPTLQRLLQRGELRLHPWKPGIPGTTPAVQAGILFGNNDELPAYRWYDKATGEAVVSSTPSVAQALQQRYARQGPGILRGGSSYMNMFDGDASLSVFTVGSIGRHRFFESIRGLGFFLLFLLNPLRSLKVLALALWEYLVDLAQRAHAAIRRETPRPLGRMFPFLRVMSNVVLREIQTFSVLLDIFRGVPSLYTTYLGYDELAHHYGPLSKPALRALRAIDARIQRIDRFRRLELGRPYDLYVLSDHGMTNCTPFARAHGQTVGELLQELVGRSVALHETYGVSRQDLMRTLYVQEELKAIEANVAAPLSRIPQWLRSFVARRLPYDAQAWDESIADTDLVVRSSGSLCHVYLNARPHQLELREVVSLYPSLISSLLEHPGIWLVIGRDQGSVVIFGREGLLAVNGAIQREGRDPLLEIPYARWAAQQIARVARFRSSGDLILMGAYDADTQQVSCFEEQWACHGGLGGPQDMALLMVGPEVPWEAAAAQHSTDIYRLFTQRYGLT